MLLIYIINSKKNLRSLLTWPFIALIVGSSTLNAQKIREKKQTSPDVMPFLQKNYSDTLYEYLDAAGNKLSHTTFWSKVIGEQYGVVTFQADNKVTVKKLFPLKYHGLVGFKMNFDSLNYEVSKKRADDLKGKNVVLTYSYPACYGCALLDRGTKDIKAKFPNLVFIDITDKRWKDLDSYMLKSEKESVLIFNKGFNKEYRKFFTWAAPTTLFINEQGIVEDFYIGGIPEEKYNREPSRVLFTQKLQNLSN